MSSFLEGQGESGQNSIEFVLMENLLALVKDPAHLSVKIFRIPTSSTLVNPFPEGTGLRLGTHKDFTPSNLLSKL